MKTAEFVKRVRESMGVSQQDLSRIIGVHPATVAKWEQGQLEIRAYHQALLSRFHEVVTQYNFNKQVIKNILTERGAIAALRYLLNGY